jgi:hypothetical protein
MNGLVKMSVRCEYDDNHLAWEMTGFHTFDRNVSFSEAPANEFFWGLKG